MCYVALFGGEKHSFIVNMIEPISLMLYSKSSNTRHSIQNRIRNLNVDTLSFHYSNIRFFMLQRQCRSV